MNLAASISLSCGGLGSGCQGPSCGRPASEYRYHGTLSKNLSSISKKGLLPKEGQYGKGIYFAPSEEKTEGYNQKPEVMLRVHQSNLPDDYDEFPEQGWTENKVSPEVIEIRQEDGSYRPLVGSR